MKINSQHLLVLSAIALFGWDQPARAGVTLTIADTGTDVSATSSGTLNITALSSTLTSVINPNGGFLDYGSAVGSTQGLLSRGGTYSFLSGATFAGPAYPFFGVESPGERQIFFSSESGSKIGLGYAGNSGQVGIAIPTDYVNGAPISSSGVWANKEYSDLGLTAGTSYTWTWGTGATADSFTINVNPVPEPSSSILLLSGLLLFRRWRLHRPGGSLPSHP